MNITNQIYLGAEDAMSFALAGASRPDGLKRLARRIFYSTTARRFLERTTLGE